MTILVDLDDTMTYLCKHWCDWLNQKYGTKITDEDIVSWEVCEYYPGLRKEQVFEPLNTDSFWESIEPKPGAVEYVKKLIDDGHDVYVCTASYYTTIKTKYEMTLKRYFPFINWDNVIITSHKQLIKADFLIDDGIHNLVGGEYKKILMSTPHNLWFETKGSDITRVSNWAEAYNVINKCKKGDESNGK